MVVCVMQDFSKLRVWRDAQALTVDIYVATEQLTGRDAIGLRSQLRRASSSIGANIAEGAGAGGAAQFARYLQIAIGSTSEVVSHLDLAERLKIFDKDDARRLVNQTHAVRRMLAALRKRVLSADRTVQNP